MLSTRVQAWAHNPSEAASWVLVCASVGGVLLHSGGGVLGGVAEQIVRIVRKGLTEMVGKVPE